MDTDFAAEWDTLNNNFFKTKWFNEKLKYLSVYLYIRRAIVSVSFRLLFQALEILWKYLSILANHVMFVKIT